MPVNFIQPTFAAGEIAPSLYARVDLAKYHAACKLLRNFFIWAHGGVSNRAGTQFVGRAKDSANPVHLIPFQFNLLQTYVLEFGHLYMRVIMNGGYVLEPALPISSITQANPGVVSAGGQGSGANILCNLAGGVIVGVELISGGSGYQGNVTLTPIASSGSGAVLVPAIVDGVIQSVTIANGGSGYPESGSLLVQITQGHGFSNGDQVFIAGTDTPLDSTPGRQYLIANATQTTFTLTDLDGNPIDTTNTSNYIDGTVARVFTLTTPYDGADVQNIKWTQSADVLTLCHPLYPPQDLERTEHWVWTLDPISFAPQISAPANVSASAGSAGSWNFAYVVTALSDTPPEESLGSQPATCTGIQLDLDTGASNTVTWSKITAANRYHIYKANPSKSALPAGAMFGYIGQATGTSFEDMEIAPDFSRAPPQAQIPSIPAPSRPLP